MKRMFKKIISGAFLFYLIKGILWLVLLFMFPQIFTKIFGE